MSEETGRYLCIAALTGAGVLAGWTAWACHRARKHGAPGSDAIVWAGLAVVLVGLAQTKVARLLGWLQAVGAWLRTLAKEHHLYGDRRPFQIAVSFAVAAIVVALLVHGLVSWWDYIRRYRLAIGFSALALGFGFIRFVSLHEVDAWNAQMPWIRVAVDLSAAAGASMVSVARLRQLRD